MFSSWFMFICSVFLLPMYIFPTLVLKLLGQPDDVAELSGTVGLLLIPLQLAFVFYLPVHRFLQSQLKTMVIDWIALGALIFHITASWIVVYKLWLGLVGAILTLDVSWWILVFAQLGYALCGGFPLTWTGFSNQAFSGLWEFFKLSVASGVMLCLENWYYRILMLMTGFLQNAKIVVDALAVCFLKMKKIPSKAKYAAKNAPPFCEIWFINKGKHIWTREALEYHSFWSSMLIADETTARRRPRVSCVQIEPESLGVVSLAVASSYMDRVSQSVLSSSSSATSDGTYDKIRGSLEFESKIEKECLYNQMLEARKEAEISKNEAFGELMRCRKLES